jgi:hypothetical protein
MSVFFDDSCTRCPHLAHEGSCPGDPFEKPNAGVGVADPHVPQGCPCGDPELDDREGLLRDDD